MAERRKLVRSRVLKNAKFIVDASLVIDCFVRNLTVAGAQVELRRTAELPDRLTMTFDSGRTLRSCTTPLPGALPLFATGLGALGLLGWRRKRKA
jgi:hypothetical protein